ncbi:MAG: hypothetical protein AB8G15_16130 [Saprospiraceae bacterium]
MRICLLITLLLSLMQLNAQEKNNLKIAIEAGILPLAPNSEKLAFFLTLEPKLRVFENTFLGLRCGATLNSHTFDNKDNTQFNISDEGESAVVSFVPNFDYYFDGNSLGFYAGVGLGFYLMSDIDVSRAIVINTSEDVFEIRVNKRIGLLLRGGVEFGKLRFGLEYNFIPKATIEIPNEQVIGTVTNRYLGLSVGLMIGVGKKSK